MVNISTVIQIIFAEKFVSQDFTIRAAPGLSGPTNTCACREATFYLMGQEGCEGLIPLSNSHRSSPSIRKSGFGEEGGRHWCPEAEDCNNKKYV